MASPFTLKAQGVGGEDWGPDWQTVSQALALLVDPAHPVQLQALPSGALLHRAGDDQAGQLEAVRVLADGGPAGVYFTINPLTCMPGSGKSGGALVGDVAGRRWLLIDLDRVKSEATKNANATDAEKADCWALAWVIQDHLATWSAPVVVDSGNGWHLYYRVDLPNDQAGQKLLREFLHALGDRFDNDLATVDRSTHNANRISKLPGTWARKGPHSAERPHRLCRLVSVPDVVAVVSAAQIAAVTAGLTEPAPAPNGHADTPFRLTATAGAEVAALAMGYLKTMDPGIEGCRGSNPTMHAARAMVWGFDLGVDEGLALLLRHYNPRCQPPWSEKELLHKCQDASKGDGFGKPRGYLLHKTNGCPGPDGPRLGVEIIVAYYRDRYQPLFRTGNSVWTADGREVLMSEATAVSDSDLIAQLALASDAPTYRGGGINRNGLPGFFKTWGKVAWGDLLRSLPDQDTADLASDAPVCKEFRGLVRNALLTEVVLGDINGGSGPAQLERLSLVDWCVRFAKPGPWRSIRSKRVWCKCVEAEGGELVLMVAVRHELFAQLKADRRLCDMGPKQFTRRAAAYGVGTSTISDRPHGLSAVVLNTGFLAELTASLPDDTPVEGPSP